MGRGISLNYFLVPVYMNNLSFIPFRPENRSLSLDVDRVVHQNSHTNYAFQTLPVLYDHHSHHVIHSEDYKSLE